MDHALEELRSLLERLSREIGELQRRMDRLEAAGSMVAPLGPPIAQDGEEAAAEHPGASSLLSARGFGLLGRTLVAFGGAYLLRAITDSGALSPVLGAGAGLLYAVAMLVLADRAARAGQRDSAGFHGLVAVVIAFPLLFETTARRGFLSPVAGASLFVAFAAVGLGIAWRRRLGALGWLTMLFGAAFGFALVVRASEPTPFIAALFALALVAEAMAFDDRWRGTRWPAAIAADAAVIYFGTLPLREGGPPAWQRAVAPGIVVAAELALPILYLGSVAARTIVRDRLIRVFGIVQSCLAIAIGLAGAARVLEHLDTSLAWVGGIAFVLGAGAYGVAFAHVERRADRARNFHFYTTLALILVGTGALMTLPYPLCADLWAALAVIAAALGARFHRLTLRYHAALYAVAAAVASGLLGAARDALFAAADGTWRRASAAAIVALVAAAACYLLLVPRRAARTDEPDFGAILPRLLTAAALGFSVAGLLARGLAAAVAAAPGPTADAAFNASARTFVLTGAAFLLAAAARRFRLRELAWLVYPVLAIGALKLLVEDLPEGRPASLFLSFACYGGALIMAPRWLRREAHEAPQRPPPPEAGG